MQEQDLFKDLITNRWNRENLSEFLSKTVQTK